ncbi:MAG TPA: hypothetical protein VJU61_12615 [Polyangiaceae bacterium]|nr:hypothetical protein [Polyangiaceae bacterium]
MLLFLGCQSDHDARPQGSTIKQSVEQRLALRPEPPAPEATAQDGVLPEVVDVSEPEAPAAGSTSGDPSASCVRGWTTPERGSRLRKAALDMIRETESERFVVLEMRYFVGPEDAEVIGPPRDVERWYVKARSLSRPERRERWLVRRASVGRGVDAVAPFDSTGYGPKTWRRPDAQDDSLSDPFQRPCHLGAPEDKCMGLPAQVLGCLAGT